MIKKSYVLASMLILISACTAEKKAGVIEVLQPSSNWDFPEATVILCQFNSVLNVTPEKQDDGTETVSYTIDEQTNPIEIKFGFDDDGNAVIYGNAGANNLIVSKNDEEGIVLLERTNYGYVFTYTIFRDRGIGYWTKTNDLFGNSYAFISVGRCWGEAE